VRHAQIRGPGPATSARRRPCHFPTPDAVATTRPSPNSPEPAPLEASNGQTTRYLLMLLLENGCVTLRLLAM
ncbi:MAG TPA: hypothetical protein VF788_13260, partial [Pseudonocardiaceae bacterium]